MLTRDQKAQQIKELSDKLSQSSSIVFTNFRGLKLKDMDDLRKSLKLQGISFQVVKNSLFKRVFENADKTIPADILNEPLAVAFNSGDELAAPKAVVAFAKENDKLKIAGGVFEQKVIDAETLKSLAMLPGREELYAKLVGTISAPLSRLVRALNYPGSGLASVLRQRLEQIK